MHSTIKIHQAFVEMVFGDIKYPLTAMDKHTPFEQSLSKGIGASESPDSVILTKDQVDHIFDKEVQEKSEPAQEVQVGVADLESQLQDLANLVRKSKDDALNENIPWEGPSEEELSDIFNRVRWEVVAHCSWLRVKLMRSPAFELKSPRSDIRALNVEVSATGELWVKHPWYKCVRRCPRPLHRLCCRWRRVWKWSRVASLTVRDVRFASHAFITFGVEPDGAVAGRPAFERLRLDYIILKEIPLEGIANEEVRKKGVRFDVARPSQLQVDLGALGLKYTVSGFEVPPDQSGITVHAILAKS